MAIVKCEKCNKEGHAWKIDSGASVPIEYSVLCYEHAQEAGFCLECATLFCYPNNDDVESISENGFCTYCWESLNSKLISDRFDDEHLRHS